MNSMFPWNIPLLSFSSIWTLGIYNTFNFIKPTFDMIKHDLWKIKTWDVRVHANMSKYACKTTSSKEFLGDPVFGRVPSFATVFIFFLDISDFTGCFPTWRPGRLHRLQQWESSWWTGRRWAGPGCTGLLSSTRWWSGRWRPAGWRWWSCCSQWRHPCSPECWSQQSLRLMGNWLFQ